MKKITIYALLAAVILAGCSKAGDKSLRSSETTGNFEFKVSLADIASKSHFVENPNTEEGTTAALAWDEDDDISVTAVRLFIEGGELVGGDFEHAKSCYAKIRPSSIGQSVASFDPAADTPEDWWKADGDTDANSMYAFMAFYPARGKTIQTELLMENLRYDEKAYGVLLDVPDEQDGKSYNKYHYLFDLELEQIKTYGELAAATKPVMTFDHFAPLTCLFHFTLSTGDGETHTNVDHIKITAKSYERDDYWVGRQNQESEEINLEYYADDYHSNRLFGLAGTGGLTSFIFGIDAIVAANGAYLQEINIDERYSPRLQAATELNIKFDAPVSIAPFDPESEDMEEYYLVTTALPEDIVDDEYGLVMLFEACDAAGNVLAVAEKRMPKGGFLPGIQYNFNLVMGHYVDMDGQNPGSYTEIVNL
jgi:hypothetical protein